MKGALSAPKKMHEKVHFFQKGTPSNPDLATGLRGSALRNKKSLIWNFNLQSFPLRVLVCQLKNVL